MVPPPHFAATLTRWAGLRGPCYLPPSAAGLVPSAVPRIAAGPSAALQSFGGLAAKAAAG